MDSAEIGCRILERDGAGSNDVVVSEILSSMPQEQLGNDAWCFNHKTNLCETAAIAAIGMEVVSKAERLQNNTPCILPRPALSCPSVMTQLVVHPLHSTCYV